MALRRSLSIGSLLFLALVAPAAVAQEQGGRRPASEILPSIVRAFIVDCSLLQAADGDPMGVPVLDSCQVIGTGSGSIISQSGLVLTNAHVALNEESGRPRWLLIGVTVDPRELPSLVFFSRALIYDGSVDLAIVEPIYTLDGRRIEPESIALPPIELSQTVRGVELEEAIRLVGYPNVGGNTVTVNPAQVSGFDVDSRVPELAGDAWFKTAPAGGPGISGGAAIDDDGRLIGVPSAVGMVEIRCVDRNQDGVNDTVSECAATAGETGYARPIPEAYGALLDRARKNGQPVDGGSGTTATGTVTITGRIVSAETGDPIPDAYILVFKPGVTVQQGLQSQDQANIHAYARASVRGDFVLNQPVARGQAYSLIVYAEGFELIGGDDIVLATANDPATKDIGTFELPTQQ